MEFVMCSYDSFHWDVMPPRGIVKFSRQVAE